jgi:flavin-dependent dehydrogenase
MDLREGDDTILPGYGWLFPLADGSINVGAGLMNTFRDFKDLSAQRVFDAFWRMLPAEWNVNETSAEGRVLSGPLPMGFSRTPPGWSTRSTGRASPTRWRRASSPGS